jgi:endonuclease YncB( thermonuclease family)
MRVRHRHIAGPALALAAALIAASAGAGDAPRGATTLAGAARVVDGDTLEIAGDRIRIFGVDAPESGQGCAGPSGEPYRCGEAAARRMAELTAGRRTVCAGDRRDRYGRLIALCRAGGRDLGATLAREGLALAFRRYSPDYLAEEAAARAAGAGLWRGEFVAPWEFRARSWRTAGAGAPDPACPIKGNINRAGIRIYHTPYSRTYDATRVDPTRGERWFCSESEALAAGWRAPYR